MNGIRHAVSGLVLAGLLAATGASAKEQGPAAPEVTLTQPPARDQSDLQVLFWSDAQRAERFRAMEQWFAGHEVPAAKVIRALPKGTPLSPALQAEITALMQATKTAGVMVLADGKVVHEEYALGMGPKDRWTSFSVAKSFTSTLLGAAVKDGFIASLDDPVTKYIPGLAGSAYEGVTVRQLATMTSGVKWNEDYTDPKSDVAQMNRFVVEYGADAIVAQMKALPREAEPGAKWVYKTGETNLIGVLVENAVGKPLAEYAKAKIVDPAGFESGLFWMVDPRGGNIGGCCLSITLSDYARMGQFALEGGKGAVPEGWFAAATDSAVDFGTSGFGYGYQWWTYPQGTYGAQGIFGQAITLFPDKQVVFAYIGNWKTASGGPERGQFLDLSRKVAAEAK
ncbi:MAG: serine hydrolase domain-containing protein [Erythrobacter sp.]|jgi:CubicO group peptidase (beta-lactamase class C family)|uniref:serine hydrolase domain-containing protein n=1 Tax=Erythrobacter sp. TaxID=1042 RepID=UPI002B4888C1|nr:serine hydrolase domain-containing protein [Erythrobacter sp.]WRH71185.1 MAG: serine hydrolase domain-containing protein [Erythrobacter sp.]